MDADATSPAPALSDPLAAVRAALETVADVAVHDRVTLFEQVNDVLARELARLDEA